MTCSNKLEDFTFGNPEGYGQYHLSQKLNILKMIEFVSTDVEFKIALL